MVLEIVYSITDPPIKALRRVIPPLRIGSIAIDLSFIIVMIVAYLLLSIIGLRWCHRPHSRSLPVGSSCHIQSHCRRYSSEETVLGRLTSPAGRAHDVVESMNLKDE